LARELSDAVVETSVQLFAGQAKAVRHDNK